jgi:hypothetical protein
MNLDAHDPIVEISEVGPTIELLTRAGTYRITATRLTRPGASWSARYEHQLMGDPRGPWILLESVPDAYDNDPEECLRLALHWLRETLPPSSGGTE